MSETFGSSIEFFGKVDRAKDGSIGSEIPAWMLETHIEELRESVAQKERMIASGDVPASEVPYLRESYKKEKERLEEIEISKPKLSAEQIDGLHKAHKKVGEQIAESMFSRDEMMKGLADAHEEARRMVKPIIAVDPELARACNVPVVDGKVSRNGAIKIWKIAGKYLGEGTNPEALRKDTKRGGR